MPKAVRAGKTPEQKPRLDPYVSRLLEKIDVGNSLLRFEKNSKIFSQGDRAEALYFIESGRVRITVVSALGKEAVLAMLGP